MADERGSNLRFRRRLWRVTVSIVVMTGVTVVLGYGGWLVLTLAARFGYDPTTESGDPLRERLLRWPERNREVMRSDGQVPIPWRP